MIKTLKSDLKQESEYQEPQVIRRLMNRNPKLKKLIAELDLQILKTSRL